MWLASLLGLLLSAPAQAAPTTNAIAGKTLDELGWVASESKDPESGHRVLELRSKASGRIVRTVYSPLGQVEEITELMPSGRLLERRLMGPGLFVHESFEPVHQLTAFRVSAKDPAIEEVEWVEFLDGKAESRSYKARIAGMLQCRVPNPPAGWMRHIDLVRLSAPPAGSQQQVVDLGSNVEAHGCGGYPGGGVPTLANEMGEGLRKGLECMRGMGEPYATKAGQLMGFLQSGYGAKVKIVCGHANQVVRLPSGADVKIPSDIAQASSPGDPHCPSVAVNVDQIGREENRLIGGGPGAFFHEMLHLLGYRHGNGIDVPWLVEIACFSPAGDSVLQERAEAARKLLLDKPDWRGLAYQRGFMTQMKRIGRGDNVGAPTAWDAMLATRGHDTAALFGAMMTLGNGGDMPAAQWREVGSPFLAMMLGRAATGRVHGATPDQAFQALRDQVADKYYPESDSALKDKRELALWVGTIASKVLERDTSFINQQRDRFREVATRVCPTLSSEERRQLKIALQTTGLQLGDESLSPPVNAGLVADWAGDAICR